MPVYDCLVGLRRHLHRNQETRLTNGWAQQMKAVKTVASGCWLWAAVAISVATVAIAHCIGGAHVARTKKLVRDRPGTVREPNNVWMKGHCPIVVQEAPPSWEMPAGHTGGRRCRGDRTSARCAGFAFLRRTGASCLGCEKSRMRPVRRNRTFYVSLLWCFCGGGRPGEELQLLAGLHRGCATLGGGSRVLSQRPPCPDDGNYWPLVCPSTVLSMYDDPALGCLQLAIFWGGGHYPSEHLTPKDLTWDAPPSPQTQQFSDPEFWSDFCQVTSKTPCGMFFSLQNAEGGGLSPRELDSVPPVPSVLGPPFAVQLEEPEPVVSGKTGKTRVCPQRSAFVQVMLIGFDVIGNLTNGAVPNMHPLHVHA